jgi:serine/threonine protein phosphatase 1
MLIYAIGDIHGCHDPLMELLEHIAFHAAGRPYRGIFLGDYVDRGPKSREAVRAVRTSVETGRWTALKGNHEEMMVAGLSDPKERDFWLEYGGDETLASYASHDAAMKDDLAWFATLPTMIETAHHIFVHAGLDPRQPLDRQSDRSRLWIRGWAQDGHDFGKHVVYGHTPHDAPLLLPHSTCLDTGAYRGGPLTAGVFDEDSKSGPLKLLQAR